MEKRRGEVLKRTKLRADCVQRSVTLIEPSPFRVAAQYRGGLGHVREQITQENQVAGGPGFEPRLTESESAVLPLNYPPAGICICLQSGGLQARQKR